MRQSEQIDAFSEAFCAAQAGVAGATRDAVNPHRQTRYADLKAVWAACKKALTDQKIGVIQSPEYDPAVALRVPVKTAAEKGAPPETVWIDIPGFCVVTKLLHGPSGQWIEGTLPLLLLSPDMQALGSAITYAKRQALASMMGVWNEDDDGEAASRPRGQRRREEPPRDRNYRDQDDGLREVSEKFPGSTGDPERGRPADDREPDHAGQGHNYGQPRNGKALYAWTLEQKQRHEVDLLKYLNSWAKLQGYPFRMTEWDAEQVALGYEEATRKLQTLQQEPGEAYEDALSN